MGDGAHVSPGDVGARQTAPSERSPRGTAADEVGPDEREQGGVDARREPDAPRDAAWIDRNVRFFYLQPRTVGRREQLCLRAPDGNELGWKDVASGRVMVRDQMEQARLVQAILEAAGPAHMPLPASDLPGVPLDIPSGVLLALLRLRSAAVLLGKESLSDGGHRLYVTFAVPGTSTVTLGYVDLDTGERYPGPEGASSLEPVTADQLLGAVAARRPRELYP